MATLSDACDPDVATRPLVYDMSNAHASISTYIRTPTRMAPAKRRVAGVTGVTVRGRDKPLSHYGLDLPLPPQPLSRYGLD